MKPITLHPASLLVGLVLAALVVLAAGAQTVSSRDRIVGYVPAEQWTYFELVGNYPSVPVYVVPSNRRLVITKLVTPAGGGYAVNGVIATSWLSVAVTNDGITRGVLQPGDVLGPIPGLSINLKVWGYLEPL